MLEDCSDSVQLKCDRKDLEAVLNEKGLKIHFQKSCKTQTFPQGQIAFNIKIVPKPQNVISLKLNLFSHFLKLGP